MQIYGLQKTTLLDYPGTLAATIFTGGCNLRCPFCHNSDLVLIPSNMQRISEEEILSFLEKRKSVLKGVCITGGEPALQADLIPFIQTVKSLGYLVKLDTNGFFPEVIDKLLQNSLVDYIAMDIKNTPQKYEFTTGVYCDLSKINRSLSLLKECTVPYEFRTTLVREFHTEYDMRVICEWISFAQNYYLQSFEDSGKNICEGLHAHDKETLQRYLRICQEYIPGTMLRGLD